ncbi:hypothetical protein V5F40_21820 [Xanthobacter sp. DSM 14520]|uniref:hypothetical protein n=1 Tax=Xanthobacter autotrophicus (strain ATCC BAA-1158 / Py2) TaxID=78245 RepID=UPI003726C947
MDRDRETIDKLAKECGLAPFTYSPEGGEERTEIWGAWADRVEAISINPEVWTDPEAHDEAVRSADAYAGHPRPRTRTLPNQPAPSIRFADYWPFVRAFDRFERENRGLDGVQPLVKAEVHVERPLVIIVHPGDLVEGVADYGPDYDITADAMHDQAHDIQLELGAGAEVVVLHNAQSLRLLEETDCIGQRHLARAIQTAMDTGFVAWGRDMEAAGRWLVEELGAAERPYVLLTGTYAGFEHGATGMLGALLEESGAEVRISDNVMASQGSYDDRWEPRSNAALVASAVMGV